MNRKPRISIVGAGPGDPELITVKGLNRICQADSILYDALIDFSILKNAKPGCELIFVGKRCGEHSLKQEDINLLLVQKAFERGHVVRLKGGDPFIFGRGHEELEYIRSFDIDVEVIPGLSSATSLPLIENIPLTKRGLSESFWILTGTTMDHELSRDIALAVQTSATLVFLMAMRKIEMIARILTRNNKGDLPMMIIQNGSMESHHSIISTVGSISAHISDVIPGAPGILVVGKVVALHPHFVMHKLKQTWL